MAYNPVSARRLPAEDPFFGANSSNLPAVSGASQAYGPYSYHPPAYGSPQHQRGWGPISPPTAASYFPQPFANQRNWGLVASPTAGSDLAQMPTNQQESALGKSPIPGRDLAQLPTNQREFSIADSSNPGEQVRVEQQNSVKHLTCWYWANKGCRLPEHVCLYSHYDTGRLADPPVQVQRGRPAVAGKNATNPQPVYNDWKGHHQAQSGAVGPQIQRQLRHIYAKAAQPSPPTPAEANQSKTATMVKGEWFGSAEPIVNFNRPHPDSHLSSPPADSHCNMSIGIGNSTQPFHQQFSPSLHQAGDNFTAAPNPAAQYTGGPTRYGLGGNHAGMVGHYGMGGNGGNHTSDYGPGHHQSGGNNPNASMPSGQYARQYSSQYGGPSDGPTQEMHDEMKVKDEVITELAGIVEMLEINYGISIDDQTDTVQKFLNIARSMEEEARETVSSKGRATNVLAPSTSTPPYGRPPTNHERIRTAMEGSLNLVQLDKMVLAKSKARKQVVGGHLEGIRAEKLLPRGWVER